MRCFLFLALVFISSCKTNRDYFIDLNESLIRTTNEFKQNAHYQTLDFEEKARDPITKIKAEIYLPIVTEVNNQTKKVEIILDSIISNLHTINNGKVNLLFEKINEYKNGILKADKRIKKVFENDFVILGRKADSLIRNGSDLYKALVAKKDIIEREIFLNIIKNNIWYNTSHVLYFLRSSITYHPPHYYPGPVLACNTTVIQSGDSIKIFAAIGHFDWKTPYSVQLNGRTLTKAENGMIEYCFVPKGKPGKYQLPVKFRYLDQDGKEMIFDTKIDYKIVK